MSIGHVTIDTESGHMDDQGLSGELQNGQRVLRILGLPRILSMEHVSQQAKQVNWARPTAIAGGGGCTSTLLRRIRVTRELCMEGTFN